MYVKGGATGRGCSGTISSPTQNSSHNWHGEGRSYAPQSRGNPADWNAMRSERLSISHSYTLASRTMRATVCVCKGILLSKSARPKVGGHLIHGHNCLGGFLSVGLGDTGASYTRKRAAHVGRAGPQARGISRWQPEQAPTSPTFPLLSPTSLSFQL